MYCGDETGSFIGEIGSHTARFGYGGQDAPRYVVPSRVWSWSESQASLDPAETTTAAQPPEDPRDRRSSSSYRIPTSCYRVPHDDTNRAVPTLMHAVRTVASPDPMQPVTDPVQFLAQGDGIIQDWDAYEQLWLDAMHVLRVHDTNKHTATTTTGSSVTGSGSTTLSSSTTTTATSPGGGINKETTTAADVSRVTHPIFVVDPGCAYSVRDDGNAEHGSLKKQQQQESPRNTKATEQLLQLTELMMEHWNAGALFVAPAPMVAAFSVGRPTALLVDLGASGARVTPVVDGLLLRTGQRRSGRGGDWLDHCAWQALTNGDGGGPRRVVRPRYQVGHQQRQSSSSWSSTNTANLGLFHRWAMTDLMYELRSSEAQCPAYLDPTEKSSATARVPFLYKTTLEKYNQSQDDNDDDMTGDNEDEEEEDDPMDMDTIASPTSTAAVARHYELPDGTLVDLSGTRVGRDLIRVPELWFTDDLPYSDNSSSSNILQQHYTLSNLPLHKLIHSSLSAVADVDVRKDLAANIVLVGGCAVTPGLEQRLVTELQALLPSAYKPKLVASKFAMERQCASWIGASVLSSLGSFQQLWLSRTEYDEYGAALALQRFP